MVDSGASYSVFRAEIADYLGIEIEKGKAIYLEGIGGRILGYLHNLDTYLGNKLYKLKIIFSRELTVSFNILGRDNFFMPFLISFYEKDRKLSIQNTPLNRTILDIKGIIKHSAKKPIDFAKLREKVKERLTKESILISFILMIHTLT